MASSETTRALFWLVLAAAFLGGVTWWKADALFGTKPAPQPKNDAPAFKRIRSEDPNAPKITVAVHDPAGNPVPGARACLLSRQGRVVADDVTGEDGKVQLFSTIPVIHAVAAYDSKHEIVVSVTKESTVRIDLKPLQHLQVTLGPDSESLRRWRKTDNGRFTLKVNREFNVAAGKPDFMRFKMYDHLGLRDKKWPATGVTTSIPRPCPSTSTLEYSSKQELDDHLDRSSRMARTPPANRSGKSIAAEAVQVRDETEISLLVEPRGEHSLTAHYARRDGETGVIMLHLSALQRTPGSTSYGEVTNVEPKFSTFQEADGRITFQVFDLPKTPVYPTLIHFGADGTRQFIRCNPVTIEGSTEAKLERLQLAKLTLKIEGDPEPTEIKRNVLLLDDHLEPVVHHEFESSGRTYTWNNLMPLTYRVSGRSGDYALEQKIIPIKPGEDLTLTLKMKRAGALTLVAKKSAIPRGLIIKNEAGVEYVIVPRTMTRHFGVKSSGEDIILDGARNETFLPYGKYELTPMDEWARKGKTVPVTVDSPVKSVPIG